MTRQHHPGEEELAGRLFEEIRLASADDPGVTREAYGPGEEAAFEILARAASQMGLVAERDEAASLVMRLPGDDGTAPGMLCGSHLDSVQHGGNYDGLAGVMAGFLCLKRLREKEVRPSRPFRVAGFRCEESVWFGKPYIGSSVALGVLDPACLELRHKSLGTSLGQCLERHGIDVEKVRQGLPLLDISTVAAYVEPHIEQGPVMLAGNIPVAGVSGIRGNVRHPEVWCRGEAGHSGAVPRELRKDAVFAFAELMGALDRVWEEMLAQGRDLVLTSGIVHTDPEHNALTRIPGEVRFCLDGRSLRQEDLEHFTVQLEVESARVAARRGVQFDFGRCFSSAPGVLSAKLMGRLRKAMAALDLPTETVPSGAGHDAAVFAQAGVESAMIFIRNSHGSHNPAEAMETTDLLAAVDVLETLALDNE